MSASGGKKAIIAAFLANLGIAIAKFIGFAITGASSMLSEAIHSVADTGNQGLLLLGGRRSEKVADQEHPFGYGRERYFWSFVVAVVLFTMGAMFAIYEGIHKIQHPEEITNAAVPITVLLIAIGLETFSLRTAMRESNLVRGDKSWVQFVRHAKAPELPVVLLEDVAALVGLFLALIGVGSAVITGNGVWDGLGTIAIGVLLIAIALILGVETKSLLVGEGAGPADVEAIRRALAAGEGIERVIHMKTLYLGPDELLVAAKVGIERTATSSQVVDAIDAAERRVRQAVPVARVIYLEPDVFDPARASGTGQSVAERR